MNGKERDGFILIGRLADKETSLKLSMPQHTAQVAVTRAQEHLSPRGVAEGAALPLLQHVTCALRRPTAWRAVGGGSHLRSLCTQLPSQTEPGGLFLALSALALSLSAKIFFMAHNKALCSSLVGYYTKAQQGRDEHKPE